MILKSLVTFFCCIKILHGALVTEIQIKTPNGELKGEERNHYIAFEGIPYAEPPVGDLRFEPPVPYTSQVIISRLFHVFFF